MDQSKSKERRRNFKIQGKNFNNDKSLNTNTKIEGKKSITPSKEGKKKKGTTISKITLVLFNTCNQYNRREKEC